MYKTTIQTMINSKSLTERQQTKDHQIKIYHVVEVGIVECFANFTKPRNIMLVLFWVCMINISPAIFAKTKLDNKSFPLHSKPIIYEVVEVCIVECIANLTKQII